MGRITVLELSTEERLELEIGFREGSSHSFRMRCKAILLKSEGLSSEKIGDFVEMCSASVNSWVKRYKLSKIAGLHTLPGRGRKPLIGVATDGESVRKAIEQNRQSLSAAKAAWESTSGKQVSDETFRRFLKTLVDDIGE